MESEFSFNHQYSLKWNDFHRKVIDNFQNLQRLDEFVDVTIACGDKTFTAHKVVLSACSPYFRRLLKANPCQHPIIILHTIEHKHFANLLYFMYHGVVHIEPHQLHDFLDAASALKIQGLSDIQYPNLFNRTESTESDVPFNINESSDDCTSPNPKTRRDNKEKTSTENIVSTPELPQQPPEIKNLQTIDNINDMNLSKESTKDSESITPKLEPLDDLVIDEDALEPQDPPDQSSNQPPDIPTFSGSFNYPEQFTQHAMSMSENFLNQTKKYTGLGNNNRCIVCKRNYSSPSNLRAHVLNVHIQTSKTNWFECRICQKKCKTKHYLINHEMQKHGIRQRTQKRLLDDHCFNEDTL